MVRLGQLAFGIAFLVIGGVHLVGHAGHVVGAAWLAAVSLLALGVAGLVAVASAFLR